MKLGMASPSPLGGCLTNTQPVDMKVSNDMLLFNSSHILLNMTEGFGRRTGIPNDSGEIHSKEPSDS